MDWPEQLRDLDLDLSTLLRICFVFCMKDLGGLDATPISLDIGAADVHPSLCAAKLLLRASVVRVDT
jgi:hypothetical protein